MTPSGQCPSDLELRLWIMKGFRYLGVITTPCTKQIQIKNENNYLFKPVLSAPVSPVTKMFKSF